ncbi:DNA primase [Thiovulum sp. ES]|nr:DNA primase [Thiovulum sp. ES]
MTAKAKIETINSSINIETVIEKETGIYVSPETQIRCFFHNDSTPSMKVYGGTKGCYCFGCAKSWYPYTFIRDYNELTVKETFEYIEDNYPEIDTERKLNSNEIESKRTDNEFVAEIIKALRDEFLETEQMSQLEIALSKYFRDNNPTELLMMYAKIVEMTEDIHL